MFCCFSLKQDLLSIWCRNDAHKQQVKLKTFNHWFSRKTGLHTWHRNWILHWNVA